MSLQNNKGPLGDFYRRVRTYAGSPKAIVAVARKLAIIYYHMMTSQHSFNPAELVKSQVKYKEQKIKQLERKLEKLKNTA